MRGWVEEGGVRGTECRRGREGGLSATRDCGFSETLLYARGSLSVSWHGGRGCRRTEANPERPRQYGPAMSYGHAKRSPGETLRGSADKLRSSDSQNSVVVDRVDGHPRGCVSIVVVVDKRLWLRARYSFSRPHLPLKTVVHLGPTSLWSDAVCPPVAFCL